MRHQLLTLTVFLALMATVTPADAQVIPEPGAGKQLYIRDKNGHPLDRLQPQRDHYDVYDYRQQSRLVGYAVVRGGRMFIYDMRHNIIATVRPELLPLQSGLSTISIVRASDGHPIGQLERY